MSAVAAIRPDRTQRRGRLTRSGWWPLLFVGPLMLGVAVMYYYPIVANFWTSLTTTNAFGGDARFVGLQNYESMFSRPDLASAILNTLFYTGVVLLAIPLSVIIASMLELPGLKYSGLYRTLFFMPYLAMPMAISQVWKIVFNGNFGIVNQGLEALGVDNPPFWLSTPGFAITVVALFGLWSSIGFNVIILSAGLKSIPRELYEASAIDGAGDAAQFFRITVPLLTPSIFFLTIMQTIGGFQLFDALYALIGSANPAMPQSRSLVFLFYQEAFISNNRGVGAAVAMVILAFVAVVTLIQFIFQKRWVNYV